MKVAAAPWPFAKGVLPLPARVVTLHTHAGSALSPTNAQFAGIRQGVAGAVPPMQYLPAKQSVSTAPTQ